MLTWTMLFVYLGICAFVLWRAIHCVRRVADFFQKKWILVIFGIGLITLQATLLLGGLLPRSAAQVMLHRFSNYWLGFYIYLFMFILLADGIILMLKLIIGKDKKILRSKARYRVVIITVLVLTTACTWGGMIHAKHLVTRSYEVEVAAKTNGDKNLRIALISDLHVGYSIGADYLQKMVDQVNAMDADLVVVAGDIYDNDYDAISDPKRCARILAGMKSKYGTYAVYGNHDVGATLIGGFTVTSREKSFRDPRLTEFCEDSGFHMLEDETVMIGEDIYLIGRKDQELSGDGTSDHAPLEDLIDGLDPAKPAIVLVHEPEGLTEYDKAGMDVLLAGHTHAGQFFPLTIVQPLRWQNYWGYKRIGDLHTFVTSGVGVYGPNLRLFTDSEVCQIDLIFSGEAR